MNPIIVLVPVRDDPVRPVHAVWRAGAMPVLDVGGAESDTSLPASLASGAEDGLFWGVRWSRASRDLRAFVGRKRRPACLLLSGTAARDLSRASLSHWRRIAPCVLAEACSVGDAERVGRAGADGVVLKGNESAGYVAHESSFVLLQAVHGRLSVPYWIQGGIGTETARAARLAGARGVVLSEQLWLTDEFSGTPWAEAARSLDGSETECVARENGLFRLLPRGEQPRMGQDIGLAASVAQRFGTVGRAITALRGSLEAGLPEQVLLGPENAWLRRQRVPLPIAQGPMTGVSDVPAFAEAVSRGGALPFVAAGMAGGEATRRLLAETRDRLGDRPWGVGILAFAAERPWLIEQLQAVREIRPGFAMLAGGRPDQATALESLGIHTYVHVPSPRLLPLFLEEGLRRFAFEGGESGGHVGPLGSFSLWQGAVDVLRDVPQDVADTVDIMLAGGVHDARSAAMAAGVAAPLLARGMGAGLLLGTAYLLTEEAVSSGAIGTEYQRRLVEARETLQLATDRAHVVRCVPSPYALGFEAEKRRSIDQLGEKEGRRVIEEGHVRRLTLAAKGADREGAATVDDEEVRREGLFLAGQIAGLRDGVTTIPGLHRDVVDGARALLREESRQSLRGRRRKRRTRGDGRIAVVGMAARFADASSVDEYWDNILAGRTSFRDVPAERFDIDRYYDADRAARDGIYCRRGSFLGPMWFDPVRYGIPPASLASVDPTQLFALDAAAGALEDAGYDRLPFPRRRTAVFFTAAGLQDLTAGYVCRAMMPHYLGRIAGLDEGTRETVLWGLSSVLPRWTEDSFPGFLANVAAGRISNRLDLRGQNCAVDAACASSLAALSAAVRELRAGSCDVALVGGADLSNNPFGFMSFARTHALTPGDRPRPFDAKADGIVLGEGAAALVLRRLCDAERDGDRVHAVILGIGSSSDGRERSLTAPSLEGQVEAMARAYEDAGVEPRSVGLVEAHATGTAVGDRVEVLAMRRTMEAAGRERGSCAVGSVKSMIGHTKTVAGFAGITKAVLALEHGILPPTAGVDTPNEVFAEGSGALYVNAAPRPWSRSRDGEPRRAAVSAFGFGGTNYHVVLEESAGECSAEGRWPADLLLVGGDSRDSLMRAVDRLLEPAESGDRSLDEILREERPRTDAAAGSKARLSVVAGSCKELADGLREARRLLEGGAAAGSGHGVFFSEEPAAASGSVCFLFPGQGSQRVGMLRDLVVRCPGAVHTLEAAEAWLGRLLERRLSDVLYPPSLFTPAEEAASRELLDDTRYAQPAMGAADLICFEALRLFGVSPDMVGGHSFGEYPALCAAGVVSPADMVRLAARRGRAAHDAARRTPGGMLAALSSEAEVRSALEGAEGDPVLANLNSPAQCVLAGTEAGIEAAAERLAARGIRTRRLPVGAAFHSPWVAPASSALARHLGKVVFREPRVRVYSNTLGAEYPRDPAAVAHLLGRHLVEPVRFQAMVESMYESGARIFVECGPGEVLTGLVSWILAGKPHRCVRVDPRGVPGMRGLVSAVAELAAAGVPVRLPQRVRGASGTSSATRSRNAIEVCATGTGQAGDGAAGAVPPDPAVLPASALGHMPPTIGGAGVPAAAAEEFLARMQAQTTEWLSLEREHLRLRERFLQMQEEMLAAYRGGARPAEGVKRPPAPSLPPLRPVEGRGPRPAFPSLPSQAPRNVNPAAEVASPVEAPEPGPVPVARFERDLLAAVCSCTGYPEDMLDMDLPMESGLGIDSIKSIEIFSRLKAYRPSLRRAGDSDEAALARLTRLRTLRDVVEFYREGVESTADGAGKSTITRYRVEAVDAGPAGIGPDPVLATGDVVLLCGSDSALSDALRDSLVAAGGRPIRVVPSGSGPAPGNGDLVADFGDPSALAEFRRRLREERGTRVDGLVSFLSTEPDFEEANGDRADRALGLCTWTLNLVKAFESDLRADGRSHPGWILNVTRMDGRLGFGNGSSIPLGQSGCVGLLKSVAREWPNVCVRNVDAAPGVEAGALAGRLVDELRHGGGEEEIGLDAAGRWTVGLTAEARSGTALPGEDPEAVVLVTGGARGIVADSACALAARMHCRIAVVGRTPLSEEPPETAGLEGANELRAYLVQQARQSGEHVAPARLEDRVSAILHGREARRNLERLRADAAEVDYYATDVRENEAFEKVIESVYAKWGRIDGVVHGAGIIRDCLLRDKTKEGFAEVFLAKVRGAETLLRKLDLSRLKFLVFFSSIAGRFGNIGQADYSAANEYLSKCALDLARRIPTRVISMDWGPWESGGMITDVFRSVASKRGVSLIPTAEGQRFFLEELARDANGSPEVLIACSNLCDKIRTEGGSVGDVLAAAMPP